MAANWIPSENEMGIQPIAVSSTTQNHLLGKIIRAKDDSTSGQGFGEFIYLLGVLNTVAGLMVTYDATTWQTIIVPSGANAVGPFAVAMSSNVATQYGWYQISGNTTILKTAVAITPQAALYVSATAGRVRLIASAGRQLLGARSANLATISAAVSTVQVMMDRPSLQGQIT